MLDHVVKGGKETYGCIIWFHRVPQDVVARFVTRNVTTLSWGKRSRRKTGRTARRIAWKVPPDCHRMRFNAALGLPH